MSMPSATGTTFAGSSTGETPAGETPATIVSGWGIGAVLKTCTSTVRVCPDFTTRYPATAGALGSASTAIVGGSVSGTAPKATLP